MKTYDPVGIIGYGFVGKAMASVMLGPVHYVDPHVDGAITLHELLEKKPAAIFLCLPTPSRDNGTCDADAVVGYAQVLAHESYSGLVVVKSTIPPSAVEEILKYLPNAIFSPEFLRQDYAEYDAMNPRMIIVGARDLERANDFKLFIMNQTEVRYPPLYGNAGGSSRFIFLRPVEASQVKYMINSFLAMKTVFMHQMRLWLEHRGQDDDSWHRITYAMAADERIGMSHMSAPGKDGWGYAGACFPKDVLALFNDARWNDGTSLGLLRDVHERNERLRDLTRDLNYEDE